jgi:hypothetical protein
MSRFLLLYDAPSSGGGGGGGGVDPATLTPAEHYNDTTVSATPVYWVDIVGSAAAFDSKGAGILPTTYNSLACWNNTNGADYYFRSASSTPRAMQWANTENWITIYMVIGLSSSFNNSGYPFQFIDGAGGGSGVFGYATQGTGVMSFIVRDGTPNTMTQLTGDLRDSTPRVYAWRIKNVTNDGISDLWINDVKSATVTVNPFVPIASDGNSTLFNTVTTGEGAWLSQFCEVILFKAEHTDDQCSGISQFLMAKWGLS